MSNVGPMLLCPFSGGFNPATQFLGGLLGLWYDPPDYSTLSQDSAGTTPVTAVSQPVGLMLDKRLGAGVPTPIYNNSFNTANWTKGAGWSAPSANFIVCDGSQAANTDCTASIPSPTYGLVKWTVTVTAVTGQLYVYTTNGNPITIYAPGTYTGVGSGGPSIFRCTAGSTCTISSATFTNVTGNHILQATAANRPITNTQGSVLYETFNGTNSELATSTVALSANMDCFIAVRRNSTANGVLIESIGVYGYAAYFTNGAGTSFAGAGTPTLAVNGVVIGSSQLNLINALVVGAWQVLEYQNLDLSLWTKLGIGGTASGVPSSFDMGGIILAPAGNAAARQQNRQYLGNKVGLTLP